MPISVLCPSCGKNLVAPNSAAGRQAQCPDCGQVVQFPEVGPDGGEAADESIEVSLHGPRGGGADEDSAETYQTAPEQFDVLCPSCGKRLQAPITAAGKEAKCPRCGEMMQLPEADSDEEEVADDYGLEILPEPPRGSGDEVDQVPGLELLPETPSGAGDKGSTETGSILGSQFEVLCPSCEKTLQAPVSMAGKEAKCPKCGQLMQLPEAEPDEEEVAEDFGLELLDDPVSGSTDEGSAGADSAAGDQFKVACPSCGNRLQAPKSAAGKKAQCPRCSQIIQLPEAGHVDVDLVDAASQESKGAPSNGFSEGLFADAFEDEYPVSEERTGDPFATPTPQTPSKTSSEPPRRPCPSCGEMVPYGASKCRFCGEILDLLIKRTMQRERRAQHSFSGDGDDLTAGDWAMAMCCGSIACIIALVWLVQGKPKGPKMIIAIIVCTVIWSVLWFVLAVVMQMMAVPQ